MTPIERAARALWEISGRPKKAHDRPQAMTPPEPEPDWQRFLPQARAVLQAIRQPSGEMINAAVLAAERIGPHDHVGVFWAMIDAALSE